MKRGAYVAWADPTPDGATVACGVYVTTQGEYGLVRRPTGDHAAVPLTGLMKIKPSSIDPNTPTGRALIAAHQEVTQ